MDSLKTQIMSQNAGHEQQSTVQGAPLAVPQPHGAPAPQRHGATVQLKRALPHLFRHSNVRGSSFASLDTTSTL
ncbi:hypothetical protein E4U42_005590 [Claviceps africana]|uniref:Uncharacterized protein n=1 Tax=Claviceps africana TaxID=83212 RepID=A0A8K0J3P7_9HYPO|nr:hypothetical protein E4U42_005590 [Claviceps africana]